MKSAGLAAGFAAMLLLLMLILGWHFNRRHCEFIKSVYPERQIENCWWGPRPRSLWLDQSG